MGSRSRISEIKYDLFSIGKVSDGWIRDLKFNFYLYWKLIDILIWYYKAIIKNECYKLKLKKKKAIETTFFFFLGKPYETT